jgi:hypothetical protein
MIAASFLQILLAVTVFLGFTGLMATIIILTMNSIDCGDHPVIAILIGFAAAVLLITVFLWLGSGPLNGSWESTE